MASVFDACGKGAAAFGLAEGARAAVSIVLQLTAEIAKGAASALANRNWYSAAALLRQLVELEYLIFLFATDPEEPEKWLGASPEDLRRVYSPASMRRRSQGKFRDEEYWRHCEMGGHPHPKARVLLPQRIEAIDFPAQDVLHLDLAHHLSGAFETLERLMQVHHLNHIVMVSEAMATGSTSLKKWLAEDPYATRPAPKGDDVATWFKALEDAT